MAGRMCFKLAPRLGMAAHDTGMMMLMITNLEGMVMVNTMEDEGLCGYGFCCLTLVKDAG